MDTTAGAPPIDPIRVAPVDPVPVDPADLVKRVGLSPVAPADLVEPFRAILVPTGLAVGRLDGPGR